MPTLVEKLLAIHRSLAAASRRHAFGGAIALAYCTEEPRGTRDLDVNVFTAAEQAAEVLAALPPEIEHGKADLDRLLKTGQTRLWWDETPVDLFLNNLPLHDEVANEVRWVPFAGEQIPVLSCESLVLFKSFFNRTRDWADIESIAEVDRDILDRAANRIDGLVGAEEEFVVRLRRIAAGG